MFTLGVGAALALMSAPARSADTAEAGVAAAAAVDAGAPRYSDSNLKRAFNYMDGNDDGMVSREEAAGFRGVAKNFDKADTNHDNALSRAEFDRAMNYVKAKHR